MGDFPAKNSCCVGSAHTRLIPGKNLGEMEEKGEREVGEEGNRNENFD